MDSTELRFVCDAMLGGLARWLRAAGYSAAFDVHAPDGELVRRALDDRLCLVTSDSGLMERYAVREGLVQCVFIPPGLSPIEQLGRVIAALELPYRDPRCMDCGGDLLPVPADQARELVPPGVRRACHRFFRCAGCTKLYWHGTHWEDIRRRLDRARKIARRLGKPPAGD
jgi:uncharacterized protein with PIN domain